MSADADSAMEAIRVITEQLRAIPAALSKAVPALAREVDAYLTECAAAGLDPDGKPWAPTELGRAPKLTGTKRTVTAEGSRIIVRLRGHDAMHTRGSARGHKIRRLIPAGRIPPALAARMQRIIEAQLREALA